jgi:protein-lysine N-methyltransferase EEF2KMT
MRVVFDLYQEISENIIAALSLIISRPLPPESTAVQRRSYVTYSFPSISSEATVTLLESSSVISSSGTTGLRTWEASMHLSSFLATSKGASFICGKRVLELGAGTGLITVLCAKYLKAKSVLATDGSQEVIDTLKDNIFLNDLQSNSPIQAKVLKWGVAYKPGGDDLDPGIDLIIGADIVRRKFYIELYLLILRHTTLQYSLRCYLRFESS